MFRFTADTQPVARDRTRTQLDLSAQSRWADVEFEGPLPELPETIGWPRMSWPARPLRARTPTRGDRRLLRFLVLTAVLALVSFVAWLLRPEHRGMSVLFWALTTAFFVQAVVWLLEWFNYWRIAVPPPIPPARRYTVDVLTTACPGEPIGMIVRTLVAMQAIRYPHTSYLCDEGDDPELRRICDQLGVVHVTRKVKKNAKAGNVNNALSKSRGQLCLVLDPDHEPSPEILDRLVGYFDDPKVGFVQSVQGYRNQEASMVARGAAEQTYHFYGPTMMGMHGRGTTQAIGANCVFRRKALKSIGGHAAGLAEDMHTAMQLYAAGWKSVYVPEMLTRGLVPSTLSAYYKQQIKWSCGAFDLLFQTYPKIFRRLTIWQKIHYLLCPFYFLSGLTSTICLMVPILCLLSGLVAWRVNVSDLAIAAAPLLLMNLLIRQTAQRFVLEPSERGFHLVGGMLTVGSWWVFMTGVICACFRVKVPYIPTPKEDDAVNDWKLVIPNFAAAAVSIAAAIIGVYMDSSPQMLLMAALALWNAATMSIVGVWGLQKLTNDIRRLLGKLSVARLGVGRFAGCAQQGLLWTLRRGSPALAMIVIAAALAAPSLKQMIEDREKVDLRHATSAEERKVGPFLVGVSLNGNIETLRQRAAIDRPNWKRVPQVIQVDVDLTDPKLSQSLEAIGALVSDGAIPLIRLSSADIGNLDLSSNAGLDVHRRVAQTVSLFDGPVLIQPLSPRAAFAGADVSAWVRRGKLFADEGAANVAWVWAPESVNAIATTYPGEYIDWVALDASLAASAGTDRAALQARLSGFRRPVMWVGFTPDEPMRQIARQVAAESDIPEGSMHAVVLPAGSDLGGESFAGLIDAAMPPADLTIGAPSDVYSPAPFEGAPARLARRGPDGAELLVDGKPFYVKGIAYNTGHDWRDGAIPLTRRQLELDFAAMKAMGCNTVRRYGTTWFDRNIFNVAGEQDLKVLFGFWLDHDTDYLNDPDELAKYEAEIEATVLAYRDHPALLGWSIGNETWGLLKNHYAQPQLTYVRMAYTAFIERMARKIKHLDPHHPVISAHEQAQDLPGNVLAFTRGAPTLDAQTVNSYYDEHISSLREIFDRFDPDRPYLVSEFGPDGYWYPAYNKTAANGEELEATAKLKAGLYEERWNKYILGNRQNCVGGVAYCWRDRFESTTSWFGINDWDGHPKPAYFTLQKLWTGKTDFVMDDAPTIHRMTVSESVVGPGASVTVHADVTGLGNAVCSWQVTGRNFRLNAADVQPSADGMSSVVTLPDKPGVYRVQFQVRTEKGLDEASLALVVVEPPSPQTTARSSKSATLAARHR